MVIQVTDYTWHQTERKVFLSLSLHHTSPKNVDIVTTNVYLKVSYSPYIFEAFLSHMIDVEKSSARILSDHIEIDLIKDSEIHWNDLCLKLSQEEKQIRRQEAVEAVQKNEEKKSKKCKEEKIYRDRFSVTQQISEDNRLREERDKKIELEKIEFMKKSAEANSSESIERSRLSSTCSEDGLRVVSEIDYDGDGEDSHYYSSTENLLIANGKAKVEKSENIKKQQRKCATTRKVPGKEGKKGSGKEGKKDEKKKPQSIPPVRQNYTIQVKYTERVLPTPSRESQKEAEDEWLASKTNIMDSAKVNSPTHSLDFYKEKAVTLFENGDYIGCVNAYSDAIKLSPKVSALYSNRAAANLGLNNLHHAVSDCSKALDLLTPPTEENRKSRLLCHIRRGTAFVRLSLYSEGLLDYRAALKLSPDDKNLVEDIQRIQAIMLASTDSCESEEDKSESDLEGEG
ncbi:Dynein assembly factor 4, axonemal [Halocaridina rubra]|uniref:Dynein assembly factor 4, axonemal n=1 Tax=Halocaridina rubra TaxID=373956 RepID=A0AAN8WR54_HALRR